MGRAIAKRWTMLDTSRKNNFCSNARLHRPSKLFHHSFLAKKKHYLELLFAPQKYWVQKTPIKSHCSCKKASLEKNHPLHRRCVLPQDTTSQKVPQTTPSPENKEASKKRPQQQPNRRTGQQTTPGSSGSQPLPRRQNSPKNRNKKISTQL